MDNKNDIVKNKEIGKVNARNIVLEYIGEKDEKKDGNGKLIKEGEIREKLEKENLKNTEEEIDSKISINKEDLENVRNIISESKNSSTGDNLNEKIDRKRGKGRTPKNKKIILKMIAVICILSVVFLGLTVLAYHYGCDSKFSRDFLKVSECPRDEMSR